MEAVGDAMPLVVGCGVMPQDDDGVVSGVAKAWPTSRGGRYVRHDAVVTGAVMAPSMARWSMAGGSRCDGVVHDKEVFGSVTPRKHVAAVRCRKRRWRHDAATMTMRCRYKVRRCDTAIRRRCGDRRCDGVVHDMMKRGGLRRCDGFVKWLRVIRVGHERIKIKGEIVSFNLDSCICIPSLVSLCMLNRLESS